MRKPSVLFINRVYPPAKGATGRMLRDLAQAFAVDGWDVSILAAGTRTTAFKDGEVQVHFIKARGIQTGGAKSILTYALIWLRLLKAARRMKPAQLLITMTDPPMLAVAGRIVARRMKARHIHWCQDLYPDLLPVLGFRLPQRFLNFLQDQSRRTMKSCDRVIAIGRCMARHLARTGVDPVKISIIPNWPDFELVQDARQMDNTTAAETVTPYLGIANNGKALLIDSDPKFRILYAGRMGLAHPQETILQAAEILQQSHPEIEFIFVGDGHEALAAERAKRGLENIRFLPAQPPARLKEVMESGDVHLISMKNEAAGLLVPSKLYSALAAKRPCIMLGPENCETAKIIADYQAGSVIAQGDTEALVEAITSYRLNGDVWFAAHQGAARAAQDNLPVAAIKAWIKRARDVIHQPSS